jgi:lipopolysaccharide transport system ATP-binding protein
MSSDNIAIRVSDLSKCYQIYDNPRDRLKQFVVPKLQRLSGKSPTQYFREFWALKDVSFEVKKGETVGIIGRNGSGKSTLLQTICGTLNPTSGSVQTNGRVAALLELGSGFNPEFTGRENVYMNASVLGLSKEKIDASFDEIVAFADIGDFIEQPVKTYSSGMMVRLAFAVIAHVDADILVIDEALAVGDAFFVQRCMRFMRKFMKKGTVIFVSHDTGAVLNLCQRAMWIDSGKLRLSGSAKNVVDSYLRDIMEREKKSNLPENSEQLRDSLSVSKKEDEPVDKTSGREGESRIRNDYAHMQVTSVFNPDSESYGMRAAEIITVRLTDVHDKTLLAVNGGEKVRFHIEVKAHKGIDTVIVGCFIRDRLGQMIAGDTTDPWLGCDKISIRQEDRMDFVFEMTMPFLPSGTYTVCAAIAEGSAQWGVVQHHYFNDALAFECHASSIRFGLAGIIPDRVYWYDMSPTRNE